MVSVLIIFVYPAVNFDLSPMFLMFWCLLNIT